MSGSIWRERRAGRRGGVRGSGARSDRSGRRARARPHTPPRRRRRRAAWRARGRRGCGGRRARRPAMDRRAERADRAAGAGRRARGAASDLGRRARAADPRRAMRCWPRACQRCSRRSWPVRGSRRRTVCAVPLHREARPTMPGRRAVVGAVDLDVAVEVHGARRRTGSSETARAAAAGAPAAPRQTSPRPGAWSCRGCACRPSASPSDRGTPGRSSRLSKRMPRSGVRCVWPTPDSTLPLRSGWRTRHGSATTP